MITAPRASSDARRREMERSRDLDILPVCVHLCETPVARLRTAGRGGSGARPQ